MSVNFYTDNSFGQYPQLEKDIKNVKSKVAGSESLDQKIEKTLLCAVPMFRRVSSFDEKIENNDILPAVGLVSLAVINAPEDLNDLKDGWNHAKSLVTNHKYIQKYDHGKTQHNFSFLRNTLLEKWMDKTKNEKVRNVLFKLDRNDNVIYDTKFGEKVVKFLGITEGEPLPTTMKDDFGDDVSLREIKAKNIFGELTARAMKRTTILGVAALSILELPKIFKATGKGKNIEEQADSTIQQTVKSGINVATITAGIGYGGAIGAKHGKAIGSLVGMGLGAVFGALISNKVQELVN